MYHISFQDSIILDKHNCNDTIQLMISNPLLDITIFVSPINFTCTKYEIDLQNFPSPSKMKHRFYDSGSLSRTDDRFEDFDDIDASTDFECEGSVSHCHIVPTVPRKGDSSSESSGNGIFLQVSDDPECGNYDAQGTHKKVWNSPSVQAEPNKTKSQVTSGKQDTKIYNRQSRNNSSSQVHFSVAFIYFYSVLCFVIFLCV